MIAHGLDELTSLIDAARAELGVRRLLLSIHDVSFPADADEDVGRGSPYTRAAERLLAYVRSLGFTGLQLGPQGQTSVDNPSPYDATFFSRNVDSLPLRALAPLVDTAEATAPWSPRADHVRAHRTLHGLVARIRETPSLAARTDRFALANAEWLMRDGLYDAIRMGFGDIGFRDWPEHGDRGFWERDPSPLLVRHTAHLRRYAVAQMLAHEAHAELRGRAKTLGLQLYGDLQVGTSDADAWARASSFLADWLMGAPPSRTNPEGQPWGYRIIDPERGDDGFFRARIAKAFAEYDGLRIDHPHGLVCPWVYRPDPAAPEAAVRDGARLFESPDRPELARFAIARKEQLDFTQPRFADEWVVDLEPAQVDRYATHFEEIVAAATRAGLPPSSLACEVLSTAPHPLRSVLERHGLGRFRVTQKADLDDPTDGYRSENAKPPDWAMIGNHDTLPVFFLVQSWSPERRAKWADYLAPRLRLDGATKQRLTDAPSFLAQALLADLFVCPAENVSVFFGDLFGFTETFNVPGLVHPDNWNLRLPSDFEALHAERGLDLPLALAMALEARGSTSGLAEGLRRFIRR